MTNELINTERLEIALAEMIAVNPDGTPVYPKGRGFLHCVRIDGKHMWCCLGVLSDVAVRHGWVPESFRRMTSTIDYAGNVESFDGETKLLPASVQHAYGLPSDNPALVTSEGVHVLAATWNDAGTRGSVGNIAPEEDFTAIAEGFRAAFLRNDI